MCSNKILQYTESDAYIFACQALVAEENTKDFASYNIFYFILVVYVILHAY